ncbi:hypothetical protein, partial [Metallosphaera sp.]
RRYLKSRRAISGAVTALILVIVSVALALAVAVFAFGLFGTFGNSGQIQAIGTPQVYEHNSTGSAYVVIKVDLKNSGSSIASIESVSIGSITNTSPVLYYNGAKVSNIPGGFDGLLTITFNITANTAPGTLSKANIGGSVPVTIQLSEGSLSPTLTLQGVLENSSIP